MASDLTVQTIRGPGSGANANQILIPTGQKIISTDAGSLVAPAQTLQIISVAKTDTFVMNGSTFTDVTGLSVSITPKYSNSKLFIRFEFAGASNGLGGVRITDGSGSIIAPYGIVWQSNHYNAHGTISYFQGDGNQTFNGAFSFLESSAVGTTATVTRKIQIRAEGSISSINRGTSPSNGSYPVPVSTLTVMEIAQ